MKRKKLIWLLVISLLLLAGLADAIRYLQPDDKEPVVVKSSHNITRANARKLMLAYNAYGGIYPGIADFFHKILAPASYPCNLCYLTFGTFSMKPAWRNFLDSTSLEIQELHKDEFKREYAPPDLPLPAILISDDSATEVLLSAAEVNRMNSLTELIQAVKAKLQ